MQTFVDMSLFRIALNFICLGLGELWRYTFSNMMASGLMNQLWAWGKSVLTIPHTNVFGSMHHVNIIFKG